jgi:hypothetical protein
MIVGRIDACSSPLDGDDVGESGDGGDHCEDDVIHRHGRLTLLNAADAAGRRATAQSCPTHVVAGNNQRAFSKRALNTAENGVVGDTGIERAHSKLLIQQKLWVWVVGR